MKTILYYFTGTGNSLAVARKISVALGDCELVPISSMKDMEGVIIPDADRVGIVCPVYFGGLPVMVSSFVEHLHLSPETYVFSVLTYGGGGDASALAQMDSILRKSSGRGLSAGHSVLMPGNYILMYEPPTGEKLVTILNSANKALVQIIADINERKEPPLKRSLLWSLLHRVLYSRFASGVHEKDRKFSVTDDCTSCGICSAICPADNIEIINNKPVWNHRCELCCGCIHLCPVQAIQAGKKTSGRAHYKNPDVSLSELKVYAP